MVFYFDTENAMKHITKTLALVIYHIKLNFSGEKGFGRHFDASSYLRKFLLSSIYYLTFRTC